MGHYFDQLVNVIAQLRDPQGGCPWDLEQTHESLRPYLIEECYEMLHAINSQDPQLLKEEMGDVLLQVILHAQLASERKDFDIQNVCQGLQDKIVRRHPHVFKKKKNDEDLSLNELHEQWEEIKVQEGKTKSILPEEDLFNPSLHAAFKIGKRTKKIKFDWESPHEVLNKVQEELDELKESLDKKSQSRSPYFETAIEEELGDILFTVAQLARHLNFDPELTLSSANKKFYTRFVQMIELCGNREQDFLKLSLKEKEKLWSRVKENEKGK
ncbi:MAG: nucleoside triphosphate pyrophosphohydrolase [Halobacteriovoraceae bacterium]|nr:nucleoside triphosphate pyrophosphohydrolase [Halobacteriovoraceae bacterium]MCB9095489.1 nucleoside triphosphate pyrophosphohydrolase [Halobacteriovoraceae bacterium]